MTEASELFPDLPKPTKPSAIHMIQVSFLENIDTEEGFKVRQVTRVIPLEAVFGGADVAQVNAFWVRFPWQPETPIEFRPSPYYLG